MCVGDSVWLGWSGIRASACNTDTTPTQPHWVSNTHRTKNNTTNVVIQQNCRKLPMMDILMSETCWAHKKWNKIASDIKLVFYSATITMMHSPINIRFTTNHVYLLISYLFMFCRKVAGTMNHVYLLISDLFMFCIKVASTMNHVYLLISYLFMFCRIVAGTMNHVCWKCRYCYFLYFRRE